jgi:hypothetical protein
MHVAQQLATPPQQLYLKYNILQLITIADMLHNYATAQSDAIQQQQQSGSYN